MTIKLAKNWRFWGIDIDVFMGHLSTLSLSLVLVAALEVSLNSSQSDWCQVRHHV